MNAQTVKSIITRFGGRSVLLAKKHSPTILTATGIVAGITSTVLASKATLKLEARSTTCVRPSTTPTTCLTASR